MKKTALLLGLTLIGLAGCDEATLSALGGGSTSAEQRADFLTAVATTGCVMIDERQFGAVEFQADLTREQSLEIIQLYLTLGKAERLDDGGVRIVTGPCAA